MHQTEPATEHPPQERPVPPCIAFLLHVVRVLLGYGRQLDQNIPDHAVGLRDKITSPVSGS